MSLTSPVGVATDGYCVDHAIGAGEGLSYDGDDGVVEWLVVNVRRDRLELPRAHLLKLSDGSVEGAAADDKTEESGFAWTKGEVEGYGNRNASMALKRVEAVHAEKAAWRDDAMACG